MVNLPFMFVSRDLLYESPIKNFKCLPVIPFLCFFTTFYTLTWLSGECATRGMECFRVRFFGGLLWVLLFIGGYQCLIGG